MSTDIIKRASIDSIINERNRALSLATEGIDKLTEAVRAFSRVRKVAGNMFADTSLRDFYIDEHRRDRTLQRIRINIDRNAWLHLLDISGIGAMMDATAHRSFQEQLSKEPPELNHQNVAATFSRLYDDREVIFRRGVVNAFSSLNRDKKTNRGFTLGKKIILARAFNGWGSWNYYRDANHQIDDFERVFLILDGKQTLEYGRVSEKLSVAIHNQRKDGQEIETDYMIFKPCKNGNLHVQFRRLDLVEQVNRIIGAECGATLASP
ncbi:DUF4942 domain-containing protein [Methylocaldum sp. BRCS4]|uniref:DUF4942 domain-containing protein n=1 Tax=Methylocaldum sp. GT1BW TaxID=3438964 RepID=UPI0012EC1FDB|nr:DUF4942 domain-containing protein [Methylocaldum sp. BRCS4]